MRNGIVGARPQARGPGVGPWLVACAFMVFAMLVVGGLTRLFGAGLSIVEWHPVSGALPPTRRQDWEALFEQYRHSPQFRIENARMTIDGFRAIFWWEYLHRLLGRLTALVFALPLFHFWRRGVIPPKLRVRLAWISGLGALQGAMGWWMVKSGLVREPRVSPVRLALHLGLAFTLVGLLVRAALEAQEAAGRSLAPGRLSRLADALAGLVLLMALSGALVAGNHAGLVFNTYPWMAGRVVPPGLFPLRPRALSAVLDATTVQFDHRVLAALLACAVPGFWLATRRAHPDARRWCHLVLAVFVAQFALGVATLTLAVPLPLAALHQANAMVLFVSVLRAGYALRRGPVTTD